MQTNNEEIRQISMWSQAIAFTLLWLLPCMWFCHLTKVMLHGFSPHGTMLWAGFVVLNMAFYSVSSKLSCMFFILSVHLLFWAQVICWIWW